MLTTFARVALPETRWHQIYVTQYFQTKSIIMQFARAVTLEWEVKINFVSPFPFSFEINDLRFEESRESTMILISHGHWCLAEIIFLSSQTTGNKTLDFYQEWSPLPLCFQFFLWLGYLTNHSELGRFSQNFYFSDLDHIFVPPKCSLFSYLQEKSISNFIQRKEKQKEELCQTLYKCHSFNPHSDPARKALWSNLQMTYTRFTEVRWSAQGH